VTKLKIPGIAKNHSLALDEAGHRLFTAELAPPEDSRSLTQSLAEWSPPSCVMGVDDVVV